jgi:hypothetical protein
MSEQGMKRHSLTNRILAPLEYMLDALMRVEDGVGFGEEPVQLPLFVLVAYPKARGEADANLRLLLVLPNPNFEVDGHKDWQIQMHPIDVLAQWRSGAA